MAKAPALVPLLASDRGAPPGKAPPPGAPTGDVTGAARGAAWCGGPAHSVMSGESYASRTGGCAALAGSGLGATKVGAANDAARDREGERDAPPARPTLASRGAPRDDALLRRSYGMPDRSDFSHAAAPAARSTSPDVSASLDTYSGARAPAACGAGRPPNAKKLGDGPRPVECTLGVGEGRRPGPGASCRRLSTLVSVGPFHVDGSARCIAALAAVVAVVVGGGAARR